MCERNEVENLLAEYTYLLDEADFDGLGEMFSQGTVKIENGPLTQVDNAPRGGRQGSGATEVAGLYRSIVSVDAETGSPFTHHLTGNLRVIFEEGDQRATATSYFCVLQQTRTLHLQPVSGGIYRDELAKDNGRWRFRSRTIVCDQLGDFHEHVVSATSK